jgi:tetratricopeptide (TPR) repeat protein
LALHADPNLSLPAAAAVLDLDLFRTEDLLESLVDISLLESTTSDHYRFHDLVRLYARACAERDESAEEREAAAFRLTDFYLATAGRVYGLETPGDRMLDHLLPTVHPGLAFDTSEDGLDWLYSEGPGLLSAVLRRACDAGPDALRQAVDLLWAGQDLMESGAHSRDYERCTRAIIGAAERRADALVEGRARILLARILSWSTIRTADAELEAQRSQSLGVTAEDPLTSSYAPNLRGLIARDLGRLADATEYYRKALDSFRQDGNQYGAASTLANLSRTYLDLGDVPAAVGTAEESVTDYRQLPSRFRLATGLYTLAYALTAAGRVDESLARLGEALPMFRESRQRVWEGMTLFRMAEAHLAAERQRQAASLAEQALTMLHDADAHWQKPDVLATLGDALSQIGQPDRARACWHDALRLLPDADGPTARRLRRLLSGPSVSAVAV